jgi:hypothetical protein
VGFLTQKTSLGSPDIPSRPRLPLEKMPKAINVDAYRDPHRDVHDLPLTLRRPENRLRRRGEQSAYDARAFRERKRSARTQMREG